MLAALNQTLKTTYDLDNETRKSMLDDRLKRYLADHCVFSQNVKKDLKHDLVKVHPDKLHGDTELLDPAVKTLVLFFAKEDVHARDGLFKLVDENKQLHQRALELLEALASAIQQASKGENALDTIVHEHFSKLNGTSRTLLYRQVMLILNRAIELQKNQAAIALITYIGGLETTKRLFNAFQNNIAGMPAQADENDNSDDTRERAYITAYALNQIGFIIIEATNFFNPFVAKIDPVEFFKNKAHGVLDFFELKALNIARQQKNLVESRWLRTPMSFLEKRILAIIDLVKLPLNLFSGLVSLCVSIAILLMNVIFEKTLVSYWSLEDRERYQKDQFSMNPVKDQFYLSFRLMRVTFGRSIAPNLPLAQKIRALLGHFVLDVLAVLIAASFFILHLVQDLNIFILGLGTAVVDYGARFPFVLPRIYPEVWGDCKRGIKNTFGFIDRQVQRVWPRRQVYYQGNPDLDRPQRDQENIGSSPVVLMLCAPTSTNFVDPLSVHQQAISQKPTLKF